MAESSDESGKRVVPTTSPSSASLCAWTPDGQVTVLIVDDEPAIRRILGAQLRKRGMAVIEAGKSGWTLPIPIVKDGAEWRFDLEAGRHEMQARLIGRDELAVIQTMLAIVDAQRDYAALDPMKTGAPAYARRLLSSPGRKDGLYWEAPAGQPQSPLGPAVAKAQAGSSTPDGHYGYNFRLLYAQGPAAPGGARDYIVGGRMIGGFGVIAWPLRYGETGVMTFIVSQSGDVYQRDLGPETAQRAAAIVVFNPDKDWTKADMTPP